MNGTIPTGLTTSFFCVRANKMTVCHTGTENMMADSFTKPVDKTKFLKCRDYIMTDTKGA